MNRLIQRIRKNPDYKEVQKLCAEHGLDLELIAPRGTGHPRLRVSRGGLSAEAPCATTPRGSLRSKQVRGAWVKRLREAGIFLDKTD